MSNNSAAELGVRPLIRINRLMANALSAKPGNMASDTPNSTQPGRNANVEAQLFDRSDGRFRILRITA